MRRSLLTSLALIGSSSAAELPVRTLYQFASNDTWLENIRTRSNGLILTTEIGPPASLLQFNASEANPQPETIVTFDTVLGLSGIAEGAHDVFYVTGANTTASNIGDPPTNATHVWQIDFNKINSTNGKPEIELIARPQAPTGFNGFATYNNTMILASATYQDSIFAIDTTTDAVWEAFKDSSMSGINGIKFQHPYVYWTASMAFYRAKISSDFTASAAELIYSGTPMDDFALAPAGFIPSNETSSGDYGRRYAFAATSGDNSILQISWNQNGTNGTFANQSVIIAGNEYSTEIAEPTGAYFGRGIGQTRKLYITTGGGSGENVDVDGVETAVGAQLLEIVIG
jgi:hypothetical protein